jgi:hypothetical protein
MCIFLTCGIRATSVLFCSALGYVDSRFTYNFFFYYALFCNIVYVHYCLSILFMQYCNIVAFVL